MVAAIRRMSNHPLPACRVASGPDSSRKQGRGVDTTTRTAEGQRKPAVSVDERSSTQGRRPLILGILPVLYSLVPSCHWMDEKSSKIRWCSLGGNHWRYA